MWVLKMLVALLKWLPSTKSGTLGLRIAAPHELRSASRLMLDVDTRSLLVLSSRVD